MQSADYFVSGLWKQDGKVTNLLLHLNKDNVLQNGQKVTVNHVCDLINKGSIIFALQWNYQTGKWICIAPLEVKKGDAIQSLYCKYSEAGIKLENLLKMDCLYAENEYLVPLIRRRN